MQGSTSMDPQTETHKDNSAPEAACVGFRVSLGGHARMFQGFRCRA